MQVKQGKNARISCRQAGGAEQHPTLSAICAQSSTIVYFCGTSSLHLLSPRLVFPDICFPVWAEGPKPIFSRAVWIATRRSIQSDYRKTFSCRVHTKGVTQQHAS